ncbi:MAG: polysaccharide biosynthesis/export family protein [Syntrophales bacterium]|nr:polysaccharide biosynthesis/export family protein [Syntrophales bacterium]MDD5232397.1 polysaccharide biosynthesis/export family protein [Syntrophales bacterium]MDD5532824.1 polysaccharide biosynthesis/export family protein [Syntrophales bacterium]HPL64223.1 polysaccharide biosynthesis/export family protein [Syntrophales bacterium]
MKTAAVILTLLALVSCAPVVKYPSPVNVSDIRSPAFPQTEYRIQPGDTLDIKFYNSPELNEQVIVRPDGRISLQLAPEITASESTPSELSRVLEQQYGKELREPRITVIVRTFGTHRVHVGGEVHRPGVVSLSGPLTVLQSVAEAGGLMESARTQEVIIIRKGEKRKPLIFTVDLERVFSGSDLSQDVLLMPFDIVYVPRSPISEVNVWVDQYIRRNIPVPFGFAYTVD